MTPRERLLEALLVERFQGGWLIEPPDEDTDISTARRRKVLAEATTTDREHVA